MLHNKSKYNPVKTYKYEIETTNIQGKLLFRCFIIKASTIQYKELMYRINEVNFSNY